MTAAQNDGHPDVLNRTPVSWWMAIWWLALSTLALNDHVLKGAGILPGWLTGKLSDVAGLVVAPVLLTMMITVRRPAGRAACFAVVVAPFVAIKVSAVAAHAVETSIGWLGIGWRLWTDPTDLAALGVLPVAWRIAAVRSRVVREARRARLGRWDRLTVVAGAAACLATSAWSQDPVRTAGFLANITGQDVTIEIFRARTPLDCPAINVDAAAVLAAAPFDPEACWTLHAGDMIPLSRNWVRLREGKVVGGPGGPPPPCDAVIVRIQGQQDVLLSWQDLGDVVIDAESVEPFHDYDIDPRGIYLEQLRDRIYLAPSPFITAQPIAFTAPAITTCTGIDPSGADGGIP